MKNLLLPKLILLDRDGVINHDSPNHIRSPEIWQPIPMSLQAIKEINDLKIKTAVITNQSGIGRRYFNLATLDKIHNKFNNLLQTINTPKNKIFFCPHTPEDLCDCRKPKPGLLLAACKHFNITPSPQNVWMIGDSKRDLDAATAANCKPILVLTGNGVSTQKKLDKSQKDIIILPSLFAITKILNKTKNN